MRPEVSSLFHPEPIVLRSLYESQEAILNAIQSLHAPEGFDCDLTYGNGGFWKNKPRPRLCYDIDPLHEWIQPGCSTRVQQPDASVGHTVFDPPFLTYVRAAREGNGNMVMSKRFSGYWRYEELCDHYEKTIIECSRILRNGATLTVKCQDIVHNHAFQPTHCHVISWMTSNGFRLKDLFVLAAKHRMPGPNRNGAQKHARIFHSYFVVGQREKRRTSA